MLVLLFYEAVFHSYSICKAKSLLLNLRPKQQNIAYYLQVPSNERIQRSFAFFFFFCPFCLTRNTSLFRQYNVTIMITISYHLHHSVEHNMCFHFSGNCSLSVSFVIPFLHSCNWASCSFKIYMKPYEDFCSHIRVRA